MREGCGAGEEHRDRAATAPGSLAGHGLPFTVLSASFDRVFGFIGASVWKLYVLTWLLTTFCVLFVDFVHLGWAEQKSCSVPPLSQLLAEHQPMFL